MKYVYDITINLKKQYLDFFEWNKKDKIIHMRKLPIIKISNHDLICFISNQIIIDSDLLKNIKIGNKYICLFISEDNCIVIEFNKKGESVLKSSLVVDEELDILENYYKLSVNHIEYQIIEHNHLPLITRLEQEKILFLNSSINSLKLPQDEHKIKYLYFECFGELELDGKKALFKIKECLNKHQYLSNLYQFFKLIQTK